MTPRSEQQQPKEYIITEFQLKQLQGYADLDFVCQAIRSRPHPAPAPTDEQCRICSAAIRQDERQRYISFLKMVSLKHSEMVDLMRRNHLKIENMNDPMQKLAFTFFSEIGELSHKADVMLEESLRQPEHP